MKKRSCHCCGGTGKERAASDIGTELKIFRIAAKLRLKEVSDSIGISTQLLSDMEHGRRSWTEERIEKYMKIVGKAG